MVELLELKSSFFYATVVAGRRTGELDLKFHGEILWLRPAEFINGGKFVLLFFLAKGATPCDGV